jgi:hypothetical protein
MFRIIEDNPRQWHSLLTYALWEDHTTTKASTGCTPFQLAYAQEAILPTEMEISSFPPYRFFPRHKLIPSKGFGRAIVLLQH